jgi:hypothetical protein
MTRASAFGSFMPFLKKVVSSPVAGRGWMPVKYEAAFSAATAPGTPLGLDLADCGPAATIERLG